MCELGSQGGMDGRWHCSAAQVDLSLLQHADELHVLPPVAVVCPRQLHTGGQEDTHLSSPVSWC